MSLCTLYPEEGSFLTLVVVPPRQEDEAQAMLPLLSPQVQDIFRSARPMAMGRWLMIPVSDSALLEDVKKLIQLRSARRR
jgi:AraC family transcriptional regulator